MPNRIEADVDPVSQCDTPPFGGGPRASGEQALDAAIPLRTSPRSKNTLSTDHLDDRAALVLDHADGVSSIAEISSQTKIPISDTIATILELVWKGFVELEKDAPKKPH